MTCLSGTSSLRAGANLTARSRFLLAQAAGTLGCGASSLLDVVIFTRDAFGFKLILVNVCGIN
jgi:hypothetical protein